MATKNPKRLVIDVSITHAAGQPNPLAAKESPSQLCRAFLEEVLDQRHQWVLTAAISAEWNKHQSTFSRKWHTAMTSRGLVAFLKDEQLPDDSIVRDKLFEHRPSDKIYEVTIKDALLVEAALASDRIIVALDDKARDAYGLYCSFIPELKMLVWVNPTIPSELAAQVIEWLRQGAPARDEYRLCPPDETALG